MKLYPILITLLNSKEILDTEEKVLRYIRSVDDGDTQEVFHSETEYRIGNGLSNNLLYFLRVGRYLFRSKIKFELLVYFCS